MIKNQHSYLGPELFSSNSWWLRNVIKYPTKPSVRPLRRGVRGTGRDPRKEARQRPAHPQVSSPWLEALARREAGHGKELSRNKSCVKPRNKENKNNEA